jgi:hypothetical protein
VRSAPALPGSTRWGAWCSRTRKATDERPPVPPRYRIGHRGWSLDAPHR